MDLLLRRRTMMAPPAREEYIIFADPVVGQICATNWGDGVGITPTQAAAVTNAQFGTTFRNNTQITSFDELKYFGITSIPENAFQGCTNLVSITLPTSVTSIDRYAFQNCTGLTGTFTIPSSVTSIGAYAFQNCTGLTGVKVLSSQVSFPSLNYINGAFAYCTGIVNMYFACSISIYALRGSGDGTGTLVVDGVYTNVSHDFGAYFVSLVVNSDANFTAGAIRGFVWTALVQIRISGNYTNTYTTSADAYLVRGGNRIKFIEIGGTITHSGTYLISSDALSQSGAIIHFGYNGIALSAPAVISDFSRISKIYVGDGSSAAHDDAILAQYLADADWAQYSAKLDTWYNYVQSGGEYATPPTIPTE